MFQGRIAVNGYNKTIRYMLALLCLVLLPPGARVNAAGEKPDHLNLRAESPEDVLDVDIGRGIWTLNGVAIIEYGDLRARGGNLYYDENKNVVSMRGKPVVSATFGENISAELGRIAFDAERDLLFASGGCRMKVSNATGTVDLDTESIVMNTKEKWLRTDRGVVIKYLAPEKGAEPGGSNTGDRGGKKEKKGLADFGNLTMTSGPVYYEMDTGAVEAAGPVKVVFEEGFLEAGALKGNVDRRKFDLSGGVQGEAGETKVKADGVVVDYETEEMTATGNVTAEQKKTGHRLKASKVWVKFARDDWRMKAYEIDMRVNMESMEKEPGKEKKISPEGDRP